MASKVGIANVALIELGRELITSLEDDSPEAIRVNAVYDQYLQDVLGQHMWSTASFQASLAQTATTPAHSFDFEYQLPTNPRYLRLLNINSSNASDFVWEKQGDKILTDAASVNISYIGFLTDPNAYGAHLTQAFIWRLIAGLTYSLTGSASRHSQNLQIYQNILAQMVAEDSQEATSQVISSNDLTKRVR